MIEAYINQDMGFFWLGLFIGIMGLLFLVESGFRFYSAYKYGYYTMDE